MEEKQELSEYVLNEEEKTITRHYQEALAQRKLSLANLRQQYLVAEQTVLQNIGKAEEDYKTYLQSLADAKDINTEDNSWVFDPTAFAFRKPPAQ